MATMYYDKDVNKDALKGKKIAIIGYGAQGRAQALNLRDSGFEVIVAQRKGGKNYDKAVADGWKPVSAKEAAEQADIIHILVQDTLQADLYKNDIAPSMKKGKVLSFSHGFNVHFVQIVPPADVDVMLVAPKGPGDLVRSQFEEGAGVPAIFAIFQNASGKAKEIALAFAYGVGGTRAGVLETTFKEETETDLFGEQAVLCGGASALVKAGFETLVNAGYQPEIAYFECFHELKLIVDLMFKRGIAGMRDVISNTAEWGDLISGPRVINEESKYQMQLILEEIQNGEFASRWIAENKAGCAAYHAKRNRDKQHQIEIVGAELRKMMPFIQEQK
jgi:ketol-acid reductoisomerase